MKKRVFVLAFCLCMVLTVCIGCSEQAQPQENPGGSSVNLAQTSGIVQSGDRKLNVSILQMPILDTAECLEYMNSTIGFLMRGTLRPELVIGVESGLGFSAQRIDSEFIEYLGALAKKYQIYFIPGTFTELAEDGKTYNTCPVFNPNGELIEVYRKKAPYYPVESVNPGPVDDYCLFKIEEKDITVGVQICYDQFFPENARMLALEGAELIVCPSYDPAEFDYIPDVIPRCRALENELFYIWTNGVNGPCGKSTIIDPKGLVVHQCDSTEQTYTTCLDFAEVTEKRIYGEDQHMNSLRYFELQYPYAGKQNEAPVYKNWPELTLDSEAFDQRVAEIGINTMPRVTDTETQTAQDVRMNEIIKNLKS